MVVRQWVYGGGGGDAKPSEVEKQTIASACERFIEDVLKPRFLPKIHPTEFNYCTDIFGKWHGSNYRFLQQYRNDRPDRFVEPEFTASFARLAYVGPDRFDLSYFHHTGQWWPIDRGATLDQAFELLVTNPAYYPII